MAHQRRLLMSSLLAAWVGMALACSGGGGNPGTSQQQQEAKATTEKTISYEVLKKWNPARGNNEYFGMHILVSEAASKQEVITLAEALKRKHAGKYIAIHIWDSREAWQRQSDETYPERELFRHYLVVMYDARIDPKIRWIAEGRDAEAKTRAEEEGARREAVNKEKEAAKKKPAEEEAKRAPQERAKKNEATAAAKLTIAKRLRDPDAVVRKLKEIVNMFPETKAAEDAREMLKQMGK